MTKQNSGDAVFLCTSHDEEWVVFVSCPLHGFEVPWLYRCDHLTRSFRCAFQVKPSHFLFPVLHRSILSSSYLDAAFPFIDVTCNWLSLTFSNVSYQMSNSSSPMIPPSSTWIYATCSILSSVSQSISYNWQYSTCWFTGSFRPWNSHHSSIVM